MENISSKLLLLYLDLVGGVDLSGVVLDDDAEDELHSILERTRKLKQVDAGREDTGVARVS